MLDENLEFDFKKLHKALSETYKRQMEIKKQYPHRFEYPTWTIERAKSGKYEKELADRRDWGEARAEFNRLSFRMTMLCCVINHAKGRLHMTKYNNSSFTMKDQEVFIARDYREFIVPNKITATVKTTKAGAVKEPPKQGFLSRITNMFKL